MSRVTIPLVGKSGVNLDTPAQELSDGTWSDAINVRFRDGSAERFKGERQLFDAPAEVPYYMQQYNQGGKRWWVHAGLTGIYADDGFARQNITPAAPPTGGIDDRWSGGTLHGVNVLNNGVDGPLFWGGTGLMAPIAAWPAATRCACMRPFKNVLVALDVTKNVGTTNDRYPHMVKWSHPAVPGAIPTSFDHTDLTKLAGELDLSEEPSLMVDQLPLGDANIIYKENAMFSMSATGGIDVFRFQRLPGSVGAIARGCVAITPVGHVVLAAGDVVLHSGQGPKSIINAVLRRWLFRTIDATNRKRAFVVACPPAKEVWVCFPELGKQACTLAAVWNWVDDTWAIRQLRNATYGATGQLDYSTVSTWQAQTDAWQDAAAAWDEDELTPAQERLLITRGSPAITAVDISATMDGAPYSSSMTRVGMAFGDPGVNKLIKAVYPRVDAAKGVRIQIEVGGTMDVETAVEWGAPVGYVVGQTFKVDTFASGRFLALRITSLDNQPWRIRSIDVDVDSLGGY